MRAVKRQGVTGKFSWIGSDGWSARALVSEGKSCPLGPSMDNSSERIAKLIWEFMTSLSAFLRKPSKIQVLRLQVEVSKIFTFLQIPKYLSRRIFFLDFKKINFEIKFIK